MAPRFNIEPADPNNRTPGNLSHHENHPSRHRLPPLAQPWVRVLAAALALAFLTEGLQHFASHRDPSWFDVGLDTAGAGVGLLLAWAAMRLQLLRF